MTNQQHPIIPPEDLLQKLRKLASLQEVITKAYQAGADQELEACCKWLFESAYPHKVASVYLRTTRRPKPPSLKEQALAVLDDCANCLDGAHENTIRRALEALPND
jgi:hypothetical protein